MIFLEDSVFAIHLDLEDRDSVGNNDVHSNMQTWKKIILNRFHRAYFEDDLRKMIRL